MDSRSFKQKKESAAGIALNFPDGFTDIAAGQPCRAGCRRQSSFGAAWMRSVLERLKSAFLLPLLGWTALGMVVDVVSGPLPPEIALGVLCECVLDHEATAQPGQDCDWLAAGESGQRAITATPHDSLPFAPPIAVQNALWTSAMIAPHAAPPMAIGACAQPVVAIPASPSCVSAHRGQRQHGIGGDELSLQLCRLHC